MKRLIAFFVLSFLILGMTNTVYAENSATKTESVIFNGKKMESSFSSSKLAASVMEMQPGDTVNFAIKISNEGDFTTDWYMSNTVLQSLEDAQKVAENGGYTYLLTYQNQAGTDTVLYDSEQVGGEKISSAGEGLSEATDSLDSFFFLDRLPKGDTGLVCLAIGLDGESQGNIYQDTLARLMMNFAVEDVPDDTKKPPEKGTPVTQKDFTSSTGTVQTGDIWTWGAVIALVLGVICIAISCLCQRKKRSVTK